MAEIRRYRTNGDFEAKQAPNGLLPAGSIVFGCRGWDYGCANEDTRGLGIEHISVTLKEDGDYPFFTIPKRLLDLASEDPTHG